MAEHSAQLAVAASSSFQLGSVRPAAKSTNPSLCLFPLISAPSPPPRALLVDIRLASHGHEHEHGGHEGHDGHEGHEGHPGPFGQHGSGEPEGFHGRAAACTAEQTKDAVEVGVCVRVQVLFPRSRASIRARSLSSRTLCARGTVTALHRHLSCDRHAGGGTSSVDRASSVCGMLVQHFANLFLWNSV